MTILLKRPNNWPHSPTLLATIAQIRQAPRRRLKKSQASASQGKKMKLVSLLLAWALLSGTTVFAAEHRACRELDYPYTDRTPAETRAIAASCRHRPVATLYYHRARHADLVAEESALARLIPYSPRASRYHFAAYTICIALIEALAPVWYADPSARAEFLNAEYDHRGEVAELRLHGYDTLADRLEGESATPR